MGGGSLECFKREENVRIYFFRELKDWRNVVY